MNYRLNIGLIVNIKFHAIALPKTLVFGVPNQNSIFLTTPAKNLFLN